MADPLDTLCARLRDHGYDVCCEAADVIERLRAVAACAQDLLDCLHDGPQCEDIRRSLLEALAAAPSGDATKETSDG